MSVFERHFIAVEAMPHLVLRQADRSRQAGLYQQRGKRLLDLAFVLAAAPIVVPLVVILALGVALSSRGNPFYVQKRVGQRGVLFNLYKLRTMVPNADQKLEAYLAKNPEAKTEWDLTQKLKKDPRVTTFGLILRKLSLDELPQLLNVVKGEMSLVGPRPMMPEQQAFYPGLAYYALAPGITGIWQVSERNEASFAQRADFDTEYFKTMSLKTDLSLILKTFRAVAKLSGY